jgi:hypothetical protein
MRFVWLFAAVGAARTMAKIPEYDIVTFQRKPGLWRASETRSGPAWSASQGKVMRCFITDEDAERGAELAAHQAIKHLSS